MLKSPERSVIEQLVQLGFTASNNESEYKALIVGMKKEKIIGVQNLLIHCNSQLVANQLTTEYAARNQKMETYMRLAHKLFREFMSAYIERFPRTSNSHVDALATLASTVDSSLKRTIEVEYLPRPSIETDQGCHVIFDVETDLGVSWMDPIVRYLKDGTLPKDSGEAYQVKVQVSCYWLSPNRRLFRRSFSGPYLRCVHP